VSARLERTDSTDESAAAANAWPQDERWPGGPAAETGGLPFIEDATAVAPQDARVLSKLFFDRLQELEEGTPEYAYARNTLIEMNLSLVHFAAGRYRNRPATDHDEIVQVGTIGLIKAIDRFDLSRETEFTTFAVPYIVGEMKRFFRDTTWAVHVPRRLQELRVELSKAKEALSLALDRDPTVAELAEHLGMPEHEVMEGLVAANGYTAGSIDTPYSDVDTSADGEGRTLGETFGACDPALGLFEDVHALAPLIEQLPERSRLLLQLRFGEELTRAEIGQRLGCSQMHVSRLLSRTIARLRSGLLVED